MFEDDELLPLSALQHLIFCERRFALVHIERLWADNVSTTTGKGFHERVDDIAPRVESRGDLRICRRLWLRSYRLGLFGKSDAVEIRIPREPSTATMPDSCDEIGWRTMVHYASQEVFPVEYKSGRMRHERAYEIQLCAQALCLEEMLGVPVPCGALYYGKARRRVDVVFGDDIRRETEAAAARIHVLFAARETPPADRNAKCGRCSMMTLCLPGVTGRKRSAARYLRSALRIASSAEV